MSEIDMAVRELAAVCQRAVMLCRAFGVPEGEIDQLQAAIDRYYEVRTAVSKLHRPAIEKDKRDPIHEGERRVA